MMITHTVTDRTNNIIGVRVSDEGIEYPIVLEALYTRSTFQELIKSGWVYSGHPYKFSKDGLTLSDLPRVALDALPIAEQSEFYMVNFDKMTQDELDKYIPKADAAVIPQREPIEIIIRTRDELKVYLNAWATMSDTQRIKYLPLNSIVAKEALFSPAEIMEPANHRYLNVIERRKRLTFFQYKELVALFYELGLKSDYTALDFIEFYCSWGICGIKDNLIATRRESSLFRFGDAVMNNTEYVTSRRKALVNGSKQTYNPLPKGWTIPSGPSNVPDNNEYKVTSISRNTTVDIRHLTFMTMSVSYAVSGMVIKVPGVIHRYNMDQVSVMYLASTALLHEEDWNLLNPSTLKRIETRMFSRSLSRQIVESLRLNSDSSSLRALQGIGLTELNAMKYIINDLLNDIQKGSGDPSMMGDVGRYQALLTNIDGFMKSGPEEFEVKEQQLTPNLAIPLDDFIPEAELADFVQSTRDGELNVGNVLQGSILDASNSIDSLEEVITLAIEDFGCSFSEVFDAARRLSLDDKGNGSVVFIAPDGKSYLSFPVSVGNRKLNGFRADIQDYSHIASNTARIWMYVTKVYTAPSTTNDFTHVAVEYLNFPHIKQSNGSMSLTHPEIESYFGGIIEAHIARFTSVKSEQRQHLGNLSVYIARAIFEAYLSGDSGHITLPRSLGGKQLPISPDIVKQLRKPGVIFRNVESLYGITDYMTTGMDFFFFCTNARLYSDRIRPYAGYTVKELPFSPNWHGYSGTSEQRTADYGNRIAKGWVDGDVKPEPLSGDYSAVSGHNYLVGGNTLYTHKYSLATYEKHISLTAMEYRKTKQCQLTSFPSLEQIEYPWAYPVDTVPCTPEEFIPTLVHSQIRDITADIIDAEFPELGDRTKVTQLPQVAQGKEFLRVSGLYAADIVTIGAEEAISVIERMTNATRAMVIYENDAVMVDRCPLSSVVDKSQYAVYRSATIEYVMDWRDVIYAREV